LTGLENFWQVLDAGRVDYRDCLERTELVQRLKDTKDFIPSAAQQLLQRILQGQDDAEISVSSLEISTPVEGDKILHFYTVTFWF
jgi:hypothetical protein